MFRWAPVFIMAGFCIAQTPTPQPDVALGKRLFESQCALCHGQTGTGGRGPALNRPTLAKAPDDATLRKLIAEGNGAEMPGAWQLSDREVASVAAFVRSLGVLPPEKVPGDPARGAAQYRTRGCPECHIMNGEGSGYGPELTSIGARRSAAHLREALLRPAAFVPDDFAVAEAVTAGGDVIRGIICNEDTFSIQVKDSIGRYFSVRKSSLKSLKKPIDDSAMPAYDRLPPGDIDDIVAFLASSKGRP